MGSGWAEELPTEEVTFPFDGSVVAPAPVGDEATARRALDEALAVRAEMKSLPSHVRRAALLGAHAALSGDRDRLETLLVLETGKPLRDCRVEVDRTLLTLVTAAEEVARLHGETVPLDLLPSGEGLVGFWVRKPIGVVVGIAGFNYPMLLAAHKVAPALAAGCPVIVKPAPQTPLATLWLVHALREALAAAGGPRSGAQLVTGGIEVGQVLTTDRRIGVVSFTGSAAVGHQIAKDAAPTKVLLELGSNAALLVADDADLDAAAAAVIRGGFYASGQACISVQRVIVVASVAEEFVAKVSAALGSVVVGDPRDPETQVSALIDGRSTDRVRSWVETAVTAGAREVLGSKSSESGQGADNADSAAFADPADPAHPADRIVRPTLLVDVPEDQLIWDEEVFGPVVAIRVVPDLDAAFTMANDTRYGLQSAIFTSSLATAFEALDRMEVGGLAVNEVPGFRSDVMPYGGIKDSGAGREGPRFAMEEYTVTRMAIIRPRP